MGRHRNIAALALLLAACSKAAPDARSDARPSPKRIARAAPATISPPGCSAGMTVALDVPSLFDTGQKPFPAPRVRAFAVKAAEAFHHAADRACREAAVRKALAPVRRVIVQSGAGAMDPTFYRDETMKPDALVFQWTFNEAGLGVPKRPDIEQGLRCFADPQRSECADLGD